MSETGELMSVDLPQLVRLLAVAQPIMEAWAKSHELDEWHCRCEDIVGTAYPRRLLPQCAGCRWSMPLEGRYDQLRCTNDDSTEAWGDVEATGCCESFLPNAIGEARADSATSPHQK